MQGSQWCMFQSQPRAWFWTPREDSPAERICFYSASSGSSQSFHGLDEAHPHWEDQSALLNQLIQMLISLTDTPSFLKHLGNPQPSQTEPSHWLRLRIVYPKRSLLSLVCYCSIPRQDMNYVSRQEKWIVDRPQIVSSAVIFLFMKIKILKAG